MIAASESFGDEVRRRREAVYASQADLADFAGVSRNTVGKVEAGIGEPTRFTVDALRRALDEYESVATPGVRQVERKSADVAPESFAQIADHLDALAEAIPNIREPAFQAMRHAYRHAAQFVRDSANNGHANYRKGAA